MPKITPFLWFDTQAEEAARFYIGIFENSRVLSINRYGAAGPGKEGSVMTVEFELDGQRFIALNGGPHFTFDEAISFQIDCATQDDVDRYWRELSDGGQEGQCGWLKDRYGLSWQVVPRALTELLGDSDPNVSTRVTKAMLGMVKIDIAALRRAADAAEPGA